MEPTGNCTCLSFLPVCLFRCTFSMSWSLVWRQHESTMNQSLTMKTLAYLILWQRFQTLLIGQWTFTWTPKKTKKKVNWPSENLFLENKQFLPWPYFSGSEFLPSTCPPMSEFLAKNSGKKLVILRQLLINWVGIKLTQFLFRRIFYFFKLFFRKICIHAKFTWKSWFVIAWLR